MPMRYIKFIEIPDSVNTNYLHMYNNNRNRQIVIYKNPSITKHNIQINHKINLPKNVAAFTMSAD